jgi:KDO2-lipid IV(A) lauroyltransferase
MMPCVLLVPMTALAQAVARLPAGLLLSAARVLAWIGGPLLRRRRRIVATNLALCFPGLDARARARLERENLAETLMGLFELLRAWFAPAPRLRGCAEVVGLDHLRAALASGRGVLLFTGHFTQSELASRLVGEALGRRVRGVVRRHNRPCVEAWLERARRCVFAPTLAKKDVRGLLRALQAGEVVVYSADQDFSYGYVFAPFFGVPAATLASPPALVRRAGARMLFFSFRRTPEGRYHLSLQQEWPGWRDGTPAQSARLYMQALETAIAEAPTQYLWAHRRFKTRPPGRAPLY